MVNQSAFDEFQLPKLLLRAVDELGFEAPTEIQSIAFPMIMSGRDSVGLAQTGTGKTLAYLLPVLKQWQFSKDRLPQILIIVPTRELVTQVVDVLNTITKYMSFTTIGLYGGVNIKTQAAEVLLGQDAVVATPGRLYDMVLRGDLSLKKIKKLIIDEADEMFSLGFRPQLYRLLELLPEKKQSLLFSATMNQEVGTLIADHFINPQLIQTRDTGSLLENIELHAFVVPNFNSKINLLAAFLEKTSVEDKILIFTSSKENANLLGVKLDEKFPDRIGVIHSNKTQNNRLKTVEQFQSGETTILVATDLVSRGLDIPDVKYVINFDAPEEYDLFVHRIGRTGRANEKGIAVTLFTEFEIELKNLLQVYLVGNSFHYPAPPENYLVSDQLIPSEEPQVNMPNVQIKLAINKERGDAFHEKSEKNKKTNQRKNWKKIKQEKYGKPKTKGQKRKK